MYYQVESFMFEELNLSGTDLIVFAFLNSYKTYKGSLSFLAKATGIKSTTTIQSSLKRLISLKLIKKTKRGTNTSIYKVTYSKPKHFRGEWNDDVTEDKYECKIGEEL